MKYYSFITVLMLSFFHFLPHSHALTVEGLNEELKNVEILKKLGKTGPLDATEESIFEDFLKYQNSCTGGVVNRPLSDFKGNHLLIGGGKKGGIGSSGHGHNLGLSNIEMLQEKIAKITSPQLAGLIKELLELRSGALTANYSGVKTAYRLDIPGNKEKAIKELEEEIVRLERENPRINDLREEIDRKLNTFYTVNIAPETDPDLVASITCIDDMAKIPDHAFQLVTFENVDTSVWLNPSIFIILERITKKNGRIRIDGAAHPRLLAYAFSKTKWADEVNKQLEKEIELWPAEINRLDITFTN